MTQFIFMIAFAPICGIVTMALLLNPKRNDFTWKKISQLVALIIVTLFINGFVVSYLGNDVYRKFYQLLVQFPIFLGFCIISEYSFIKILFTLFIVVTLMGFPISFLNLCRILSGGNIAFMIAGFLVAFLILFFVIYFLFRPSYIYMLDFGSESIFLKFSIIPVLYYIYGYLNTGYNFAKDVTLNQLFIKCIPNFIVFFAYFMLTDVFKKTHETELLKNRENLALMQLNTATEQMELLRREEKQSAIYRHDLRHHMNYLNLCITENKLEEATNYIKQIFEEMDNLKVIQYCTNESINLILTLYATKAKNKNIEISIESSATNFSRFQIIDLCSLLSNVLENAVNACEQIDDKSKRYIKFRMYEKNNKLCMYICNSFVTPPVFEHELPISTKKGHGIGVISIVHVVEKYNGIYEFLAENGEFKFQTLL